MDATTSPNVARNELSAIEKQIADTIDKIVGADNPRVVQALEKRVDERDRKKLLLRERTANAGEPAHSFSSS